MPLSIQMSACHQFSWLNTGILSIAPPLINLREIWTKSQFFSFDEMQLKCRLSNVGNFVSVSNVLKFWQSIPLVLFAGHVFREENHISGTKSFPHAWHCWQFSNLEEIPEVAWTFDALQSVYLPNYVK